MQLGASGSDRPLMRGPTGWHRAAMFHTWALDKRRIRGGAGGEKGSTQMLRISWGFFKEISRQNGGHTWLVQFGTANAHD